MDNTEKIVIPSIASRYIGLKIYDAKFLVKENQKLSDGEFIVELSTIKEVISIQLGYEKWQDKIIRDNGKIDVSNIYTSDDPGDGAYNIVTSFRINRWQANTYIDGLENYATSVGIYNAENALDGIKEMLEENLKQAYTNEIIKFQNELRQLNKKIEDCKTKINNITNKF